MKKFKLQYNLAPENEQKFLSLQRSCASNATFGKFKI